MRTCKVSLLNAFTHSWMPAPCEALRPEPGSRDEQDSRACPHGTYSGGREKEVNK